MKAIIIGAGRGSRLKHLTQEIPKTLVPILGKPILEHILEALFAGGFGFQDIVFISGYQQEVIQAAYPQLTYVSNQNWPNNNILLSLLCAREFMEEGFVSTYADIVYHPKAITELMNAKSDIALVCDTDWRRCYEGRSEHPETDAEKVRVKNGTVLEMSRRISSEHATGEFIGVMKCSRGGVQHLLNAFDNVSNGYKERMNAEFREGRSFQRAYLLDMLQHMIEQGIDMSAVEMHGGYMEIDTLQDAALASSWRSMWES